MLYRNVNRVFTSDSAFVGTMFSDACGDFIRYLEHVQLNLTAKYAIRGHLEIVLISPSGRYRRPTTFDFLFSISVYLHTKSIIDSIKLRDYLRAIERLYILELMKSYFGVEDFLTSPYIDSGELSPLILEWPRSTVNTHGLQVLRAR